MSVHGSRKNHAWNPGDSGGLRGRPFVAGFAWPPRAGRKRDAREREHFGRKWDPYLKHIQCKICTVLKERLAMEKPFLESLIFSCDYHESDAIGSLLRTRGLTSRPTPDFSAEPCPCASLVRRFIEKCVVFWPLFRLRRCVRNWLKSAWTTCIVWCVFR